MRIVEIYKISNNRGQRVDLIDILRLFEHDALSSQWTLLGIEANGEAESEMHRLSDTGQPVSGAELMDK
jgi:hypothetical protein